MNDDYPQYVLWPMTIPGAWLAGFMLVANLDHMDIDSRVYVWGTLVMSFHKRYLILSNHKRYLIRRTTRDER